MEAKYSEQENLCQCPRCREDNFNHLSDCAVHNAPAFENMDCSCVPILHDHFCHRCQSSYTCKTFFCLNEWEKYCWKCDPF